MPKFQYVAKIGPQKTIQGEMEGASPQEVVSRLTQAGCFPLSVVPEIATLTSGCLFARSARGTPTHSQGGYLGGDLVFFTRQLAILLESGITIVKGLELLFAQTKKRYFRAVLSELSAKIREGKTLSETLRAHPDVFPELYCAMIEAGEAGGHLTLALRRMADFLEKEEEFKSAVRGALIYPFFILIVGAATVAVLILFVIPRLVTMFEDMAQALPLPTQILIASSSFLRRYLVFIVSGFAGVILLLQKVLRMPRGKLVWDGWKLKMGLVGRVVLKVEVARFARTLSLLLSGGMPITLSLAACDGVAANAVVRTELQRLRREIHAGVSLSAAMKASKVFPELASSIISVGEETGTLEKALIRIADDYEREVDKTLKSFLQLLEPLVILGMGLVVGFVVISMLLPIFQINLMAR